MTSHWWYLTKYSICSYILNFIALWDECVLICKFIHENVFYIKLDAFGRDENALLTSPWLNQRNCLRLCNGFGNAGLQKVVSWSISGVSFNWFLDTFISIFTKFNSMCFKKKLNSTYCPFLYINTKKTVKYR